MQWVDVEGPTPEAIIALAGRLGHNLSLSSPHEEDERLSQARRRGLPKIDEDALRLFVGGMFLATGLALQLSGSAAWLVRLALGASTIPVGLPVFRGAWTSVRQTHAIDMSVTMSMAVSGALHLGDWAEASVTVLLFPLGEWLEEQAADRARRGVTSLTALAPENATVHRGTSVRLSELAPGDILVTRPGERIAADGRILEGYSVVTQARITGEAAPVERGPGGDVYAASLNGDSALTVDVSHTTADSSISRIPRLVETAQSEKAPMQRTVDVFVGVYTPSVTAAAILVAFLPLLLDFGPVREWVGRGLVLLVVACPCALVMTTPVTVPSALAKAARSGVLVQGGRNLESLARVLAATFDKTRTLTTGCLHVVGGACSAHSEADASCQRCRYLLGLAAALESRSGHALAEAIISRAIELEAMHRHGSAEAVQAHQGRGVTGIVAGHQVSVGSHEFSHVSGPATADALCPGIEDAERLGYAVVVARDACCGVGAHWLFEDRARPEALAVVARTRRLGIPAIEMLTGGCAGMAERVGAALAIDRVHAGPLPADKTAEVRRRQRDWGTVATVGDGVDDAPALAAADVDITMGAGASDVALETADVALLGNDLRRVPFAIGLSRRAR